jgi:hypothetical protein
MSNTIPIQDLDPSVDPPNDRKIHAVVTLSWPYSSSTRQCALLLSERDFRLRARGGQIRVTFSGPAARAVAQGKLGIGDEVVLELGSGEWASGAAVHVPGKSVGELHFGRGVQLRVQKDGSEDVQISVADDAVDEDEQETSQVEVTPAKKTSPTSTFRSSIGRAPGSAAIYSSPAYMRKAARFSYLDGISRLFEDEWDNQDLPRKKARTSLGEVKSWKVVDRTPSPELSPPAATVDVEKEMLDASHIEEADVREMPTVESVTDQEPTVDTHTVRSSPTPAPMQQIPGPSSPPIVTAPLSSPLELLAAEALAGQQPEASINASTLPTLHVPSSSPTPQTAELRNLEERAFDPTTPRLVPLPSAALPSTTPQISPLATRGVFATDTTDDRSEDNETFSEQALPSDGPTQQGSVLLTSPNKAMESLLDQLKSTTGESEIATEPVLPEEDASADELNPWESGDLAEEDAFSDDDADEVLSAYENDAELMPEDDAEDVFDADELEGEEPSDDDTNEDLEMYNPPVQELMEESSTEKDSDIAEQASLEDQVDSEMTVERRSSFDAPTVSRQPGFTPASTLLNAAETPAKIAQQPAATESYLTATPSKMPFFGFDGALPSTEEAEVTTPATKPTDTPKRTPQSARDKVMKKTFNSLFGLKGTPSPEKEDPVVINSTISAEENTVQIDQHDTELSATQILQPGVNGMMDSQLARTHAVDIVGEAAVEAAVFDEPRQQQDNVLATDAGPQEVHDVTVDATELPDKITQDVQNENPSPEAAPFAREDSPELVKLDSSSDAEDEDNTMEESEADHPNTQPIVSTPTPQKRSKTKGPEMDVSVEVVSGRAESPAISVQENVTESAEPEITLPHTGEQSKQSEDLEIEHPPPIEDQQETEVPTSPEGDVGILEQGAVLPGTIPEPKQSTLDSVQQPSALSPVPKFPAPEVEESQPVDIELQGPSQHEPLQVSSSPAERDVSVAGNEALQELFEPLQPSAALQDEVANLASPARESVVASEVQVVDLLQEEDIEMLDDGHQEPDVSQVSFQSQMTPELDVESAPVVSEQPTVSADIVQIEEPLQESPQKEDVEMMDGGREETQSSHVFSQSQVLQDSTDAQKPDLVEFSSRPASRDTVEDFSPMVLESMTQRIADVVSDDSALKRLQELESEDGDVEINGPNADATLPSMAESVEEDTLEQTPTRSAKVQAVEVEFSPAQPQTFSPSKVTRTVREQQPTPQATLEVDMQETIVTNEEVAAVQENTLNHEEPSASDLEALESQLQTELVGGDVLHSSNALSPEVVEQRDLSDITDHEDDQANFALPLSPSATQLAEPETQLSHANTAQAVVQPTLATSEFQSLMQPQIDLVDPEASENLSVMSQAEARDQRPAESLEDPATTPRPQSRDKEARNMPPPEQTLPPKTPVRRSLRSRLSNVPDVISAWFSPKRSSIAAQDSEDRTIVETPKATDAESIKTPRTTKRRASGLSTAHAYFTSLASLSQHLNPSSQQAGTLDILAVVTDFTKEPERAKRGPRDYYTIFRVADLSMPASTDVRVEVYRPWKAVLPAADVGDVVLLRAFIVKSKERQAYLLSTETSSWCVWRFAEHSKTTTRRGAGTGEDGQPVWARRMSHIEVREEVKGPPVEYGVAEKEQARKLRDWWVETHGETQEGATAELVGKEQDEETEVVEV